MKAYYDNRPAQIEAVGDGGWHYRYNIAQVSSPSSMEGEEQQTQWLCDEVIVYELTSDALIKAVISQHWDITHEMKLVNEYNAANLGVFDDELQVAKVRSAYLTYLMERQVLRDVVAADCENLNIR